MFHDSLFRNPLDQPTPIFNDVHLVISSGNKEKGSCISTVEEQSVEDISYISSLCQVDDLSFLADLQSSNLDNLSNDSEPRMQVDTLNNHHHNILFSINTYGREHISISSDIFSFSEGLDL